MSVFADPINAAVVAAFGEVFLWYPAAGGTYELRGIYDSRHYPVEAGDGPAVSAMETTLAAVASDMPDAKRGDEILVRGIGYRIADKRTDGQDMVVLVLEKDQGSA